MRKTFNLISVTLAGAMATVFVGSANAQRYEFSATLTGASMSPATATTAGGTAHVIIGKMLFEQRYIVEVTEWFFGLSSNYIGSHLHCCTTTPLTGTATVGLDLTGLPLGSTTGIYYNSFTLTPAEVAPLLDGALAGKAYIDIHTSSFPGGEIGGFLTFLSYSPIPEPAQYTLLLGGLAVVGSFAARRRSA
jgi:hypothetical protein